MQTDMSSLTNLDMHDQFAKPQSNGAALLKTNSSKEYSIHAYNTLKVYMTDLFLFARLNLLNVLISVAKKIFR